MCGGIVVISLLLAVSKVSVRDFRRNLRAFTWLFVLTFGLHIFFGPGDESIRVPYIGWEVSQSGVYNGFYYSLRIFLLLAFSYIFMATTSPLEIADGIERTLRPLQKIGFPANETAMILSLALRFVPTLLDEARRIRDAQICRGARLDGNVLHKVKGFSAMLIPLFASALRRADNLALAIEARGYRGGKGRTSYFELRFKTADFEALSISALIVLAIFVI